MVNHRRQDEDLSAVFAALADPSRRRILDQLADGPTSVSALAAPLGVSLPAVLKQVAVLEDARLVVTRKEGRVRTCSLRPRGLDHTAHWLHERQQRWDGRLDRLGAYLKGSTHGS
jgi:DNA-binding transcriptional ArsR family regulator